MKTVAILQARMSSSRLPGKVMLDLLGKPLILRQIERVRGARRMEELVLATSEDPSDDALATFCEEEKVGCFRGSLEDVLDRFYRAAQSRRPDYVVRLTGDCPLADPAVIDEVIAFCQDGGYDYASNTIEPTYPDGLDVEVFKYSALESAWREAKLPSEREHVTPFIYKHGERFKIGSLKSNVDMSGMRWTVDVADDYSFVKKIFEELYPKNNGFGMKEVIDLLSVHPEWSGMNDGIERNEGYAKSLQKDGNL